MDIVECSFTVNGKLILRKKWICTMQNGPEDIWDILLKEQHRLDFEIFN